MHLSGEERVINMSHVTRKRKEMKRRNDRFRVVNGFNTGTRNMGYESNQERKIQGAVASIRHEMLRY